VSLRVFDVSGREVRTIVDGDLAAGSHTARWDGKNADGVAVGSGVYVYRLETPGEQAERKLTVMR
jgi:flagellar hook assembly protein FlgD